jgi:hypothetical protein
MRIVKWIVSVLALAFLYIEIFVRHDAISLIDEYAANIQTNYPAILLVLLLMPLNWMVEAYKWRMLFNVPSKLSFWDALKGVLMGVTLGLFTPNGIGEFGGRLWVVDQAHREKAVSSSIVGSLSQLCITITIGGAFIVFHASQLIAQNWLITAQALSALTVLVGLYAYYKMPQIASRLFNKIKFFNRFENFKKSLQSFTTIELSKAYLLSLFRYGIFCSQLGILLYSIGGLSIGQLNLIVVTVPIYYYIQTIIPTVALSEIGVRGLILLFLFSGVLIESEVILISFLIWITNLIIPGLLGLALFIKTRFTNQ